MVLSRVQALGISVRDPISNNDVNYDDLDALLVTMDLQTLGELAVDIVNAWCDHRGMTQPRLHDVEGNLTKDAEVISGSAWNSVLRQNDRREFAASIMADLSSL